MQAYKFKHRETAAVYTGVSDDLHIAVSVRGTGAELACRTAAEMVLREGRGLLNYPPRKLAYLLSEQLRLASEENDMPIGCALAFAAADEGGEGWLFAAGGAAAYHCTQQKFEKTVTADSTVKPAADFPEHWENAGFEHLFLKINDALAVSADPTAVHRMRKPILDNLRAPKIPDSVKANNDYSYAMLLIEEEEVQENV